MLKQKKIKREVKFTWENIEAIKMEHTVQSNYNFFFVFEFFSLAPLNRNP